MSPQILAFTHTPYKKDDVLLASLIPNKHYPNQDMIANVAVKESEDYSVAIDANFSSRVQTGSDSFFKIALTRLFSVSNDAGNNAVCDVEADHALIYELRQPTAMFARICEQDAVRKWLQERHRWSQKSYFIVGYRTLVNAKLIRRQEQSSRASVRVIVPVAAAAGVDPSLTGVMDPEVGVGIGSSMARGEILTPLGERIYGICYRRVRLSVHKGSVSESDVSENRWKSTFQRRGKSQNEFVEASLEEDEFQQIEVLNGEEGFALLSPETEQAAQND